MTRVQESRILCSACVSLSADSQNPTFTVQKVVQCCFWLAEFKFRVTVQRKLRKNTDKIHLQDKSPSHYTNIITDFLKEQCPDKWNGRECFFAWPPRSPDLNPLDFLGGT